MSTLAGRHALVTGGGTGIGAAIARALAGAGAMVTICGRRSEPLRTVAAGAATIRTVMADVTDEAAMTAIHQNAEGTDEPIDMVVANAGAAQSAPAHKTSLELWNATLAVNLTGAFLAVKPALAGMRARGFGRIVFIASTAGLEGYAYVAPYVAAKHGVIGLMRALALETASAGVTVNAVCPGFTETGMLAESIDRIAATTGRDAAEVRASLAAGNPQGRLATPDEVAAAVLRLCGPAGASITGRAISIPGEET
ncbi:MAG TPA: SDR family NAD(P)-dependent oxidoreductase [Xanthobacteraceae bacterium]|nr:SDR family NAD(P)-dependent oxidoreductase [Xanthobacteraceae bacterium]